MRLDLPGLQAFLSIAERGSFHAAAAHLNLSQTALSHRIRKLEDLLEVRLLARTTRKVSLTPQGVELLPKARKLVDDMAEAFDGLRQQAHDAEERIAIGCLPTVAVKCLPQVLARFKAIYPDTNVRIHDNSATEIAEKVQSGSAAFGITVLGANRWDLEGKPIVREPFMLVCHRDMPLAKKQSLSWAEIDGLPLVRISAETGNRILIDDALGKRRDSLLWQYEVQRVTTAVSLVRSGIGYTVVPKLAFDVVADQDLVAISLTEPAVSRTLGVITRKGLPLLPRARRLLALIEENLGSTMPSSL
jgi:DNA-binding transcriptional LysR family regulator